MEKMKTSIEGFVKISTDGMADPIHIQFPTTADQLSSVLGGIGRTYNKGDDFTFDYYICPTVPMLQGELPNPVRLDELNYLAHLIIDLDPERSKLFDGLVDIGFGSSNGDYTMQSLINLRRNLGKFALYTGFDDCITNNQADIRMGKIIALENGLPEAFMPFFDRYQYCQTLLRTGELRRCTHGYIQDLGHVYHEHYKGYIRPYHKDIDLWHDAGDRQSLGLPPSRDTLSTGGPKRAAKKPRTGDRGR